MTLLRFLVVRVLTGAAVVVAVVAATWLTLFLLRPNLVDDGSSPVAQLTGFLQRVFFHLDFGRTLRPGDPTVASQLRDQLPADLALLLGGIAVGLTLGLGGGALSALRPRGVVARTGETLALVAFAAPVYVVGLGLLLLFGSVVGVVDVGLSIPLQYVEFDERPLGWLGALIVPWIVLGLPLAGLCFRVMSGMTVAALDAPYVQTARAKGLRHRRVVLRHAAPSGLLPALTLAGSATNATLLNLALLEPVFGVPGAYRSLPDVVGSYDVSLLFGLTFVTAVLVVAMNLSVDLVLHTLDPITRAPR